MSQSPVDVPLWSLLFAGIHCIQMPLLLLEWTLVGWFTPWCMNHYLCWVFFHLIDFCFLRHKKQHSQSLFVGNETSSVLFQWEHQWKRFCAQGSRWDIAAEFQTESTKTHHPDWDRTCGSTVWLRLLQKHMYEVQTQGRSVTAPVVNMSEMDRVTYHLVLLAAYLAADGWQRRSILVCRPS